MVVAMEVEVAPDDIPHRLVLAAGHDDSLRPFVSKKAQRPHES